MKISKSKVDHIICHPKDQEGLGIDALLDIKNMSTYQMDVSAIQ
jgi:hypothetical protein